MFELPDGQRCHKNMSSYGQQQHTPQRSQGVVMSWHIHEALTLFGVARKDCLAWIGPSMLHVRTLGMSQLGALCGSVAPTWGIPGSSTMLPVC
jgi:hypothetical protein